METDLCAFRLADRQVELDRASTARVPRLLARKVKRQLASPFSFFRGSAPLFHEILAARPELRLPTTTEGAIVGDMHLENVGAYRTDDDRVTFGLNDFDDATTGPHWLDTLRLSTAVLLAGRAFKASAAEALSLVHELQDAYAGAALGRSIATAVPDPIATLCARAERRTRKELLDLRAPSVRGQRRFERGERYFDLDADQSAALPALVEAYRAALALRAPKHAASWRVRDAAFRVAGTGSLGRIRIALLLADEDGTERLFELKEETAASAEALLGPATPDGDPARRVVDAAFALAAHPPRQLAALPPHPVGSFIGRKLCPEEDKLDLARLAVGQELTDVVRTVGALVGAAHRRASPTIVPADAPADRDALVDRAVVLAGTFEATYLAYARRFDPRRSGAA